MDIELEVLPAVLQCNNYETPKWGADRRMFLKEISLC